MKMKNGVDLVDSVRTVNVVIYRLMFVRRSSLNNEWKNLGATYDVKNVLCKNDRVTSRRGVHSVSSPSVRACRSIVPVTNHNVTRNVAVGPFAKTGSLSPNLQEVSSGIRF